MVTRPFVNQSRLVLYREYIYNILIYICDVEGEDMRLILASKYESQRVGINADGY